MLLKMFILIFGFVWPRSVCQAQYNMYEGDCLDYYVTDDVSGYLEIPNREQHQIIPFCRRDQVVERDFEAVDRVPIITLSDLYEQNTTIEQLYSWSAQLDFIEDYQAYRRAPTQGSPSIFYNCSSTSKFGRYCQYSFESQVVN